jgi:hypothetical protein
MVSTLLQYTRRTAQLTACLLAQSGSITHPYASIQSVETITHPYASIQSGRRRRLGRRGGATTVGRATVAPAIFCTTTRERFGSGATWSGVSAGLISPVSLVSSPPDPAPSLQASLTRLLLRRHPRFRRGVSRPAVRFRRHDDGLRERDELLSECRSRVEPSFPNAGKHIASTTALSFRSKSCSGC